MPPRFGWGAADLWIPQKPSHTKATDANGFDRYWFLLGHLRRSVSERQAQADLSVVAHRLSSVNPKDYPKHFTVEIQSLSDTVVGRFRVTLFIILAAWIHWWLCATNDSSG
jgi:hypothetical protein